jgi:UDP-glucose 4-epimerase
VNREEMSKAIDHKKYFRIPADNRTLNYDLYFSEGENSISDEYNSHNTKRLGINETIQLLLKLEMIRNDIKNL